MYNERAFISYDKSMPLGFVILDINHLQLHIMYIGESGMQIGDVSVDDVFAHLDKGVLEFVEIIPKKHIKELKKMALQS